MENKPESEISDFVKGMSNAGKDVRKRINKTKLRLSMILASVSMPIPQRSGDSLYKGALDDHEYTEIVESTPTSIPDKYEIPEEVTPEKDSCIDEVVGYDYLKDMTPEQIGHELEETPEGYEFKPVVESIFEYEIGDFPDLDYLLEKQSHFGINNLGFTPTPFMMPHQSKYEPTLEMPNDKGPKPVMISRETINEIISSDSDDLNEFGLHYNAFDQVYVLKRKENGGK